MLTEHLMSFAPTAIGLRHMEQTKAGAGDIGDTVTGRGSINEINLRTGTCAYKDM